MDEPTHHKDQATEVHDAEVLVNCGREKKTRTGETAILQSVIQTVSSKNASCGHHFSGSLRGQ